MAFNILLTTDAYKTGHNLKMHKPLVLTDKQLDAIKDRWINMRGKVEEMACNSDSSDY